jgi:hypothetical protein
MLMVRCVIEILWPLPSNTLLEVAFMRETTRNLALAALLIALGAAADEAPAGRKLKGKLFPEFTKDRQYLVWSGQTPADAYCFLNVEVTDTHVSLRVENKKDLEKLGSDAPPSSVLTVFSDPKYGKSNDTTCEETGAGVRVLQKSDELGGTKSVADLTLKLSEPSGDYRSVSSALLLNSKANKKYPTIPHDNYKISRSCSSLRLIANLTENEAQGLADQAAEIWNDSHPNKRQTGEVMFLGCSGLTPDTVSCIADGEGEGDGDEPYLEWTAVSGPDGKLTPGKVKYNYR